MKKCENMKKLKKAMKKVQTEKRYEHTLGVAYTATALAMRYDASLKDAQTAGLLHDCAKCLSDEKLLSICKKHNLPISGIEQRKPYLLHAKVGAFLAENKYGVRDKEILDAIRYHTTGRGNMCLMEKIIFVADYIEPGRKTVPNMQKIRQLAFIDLDKAVLCILENILHYLKETGAETDPGTEATLKYYKNYNLSE